MAPRPEANKPTIVVAVDFGTTFTGVAYAYLPSGRLQPENISIIQKWPEHGPTSDKVPSRFAYVKPIKTSQPSEEQGSQNPAQSVFKWGFSVEPEDHAIECIKLLLETGKALPKDVNQQAIHFELARHNKTVEAAITDFLCEIFKYTQKTLIKKFRESCVTGARRQYILTVPAMWSDEAKENTKSLAVSAGFPGDLQLVSEPEAAAIFALQKNAGLDPKVGDNFVVCDAGGGTVDLISYEITRLKPLRVKESVAGTGGLCGGSFVNTELERLIKNKTGITKFENFKQADPQHWHETMTAFEEGPKRNFDPYERPDKEYNIKCSGLEEDVEAGIAGSHIKLSTEAMKRMFKPVSNEVKDLCSSQVDKLRKAKKRIAAVILTGGFGQSAFLRGELKDRLKDKGIEVLEQDDAWSAIAKGAIFWATQDANMVQSRKSRHHYGTEQMMPFDPAIHDAADKKFHELEEKYYVDGCFRSYIENGQTISVQKTITHNFFRSFTEAERSVVKDTIFVSSYARAPAYITDPGVSTLCSFSLDLRDVPKKYFKTYTNSEGLRYFILDLEYKMRLESGGLKFWAEIGGKEYGTVTTEFK